MKKVLITIAALAIISISVVIIIRACQPAKYVIYNADNLVLLKTNDVYKFSQTEKYLIENGETYTVIYNN